MGYSMRYLAVFLLLIAMPIVAMATSPAEKFAASLGDDALVVLSNDSLSKQAKRDRLEAMFKRTVDTEWIGRFVTGKNWRSFSEAQKEGYLAAYDRFITKHYTSNFEEYSEGTDFAVVNSRNVGKNDELVTMKITRSGASPIMVKYRLRPRGDSFKVVDIVVEGVSLITAQRSEFSSVLERHDVNYLIDQLNKKAVR